MSQTDRFPFSYVKYYTALVKVSIVLYFSSLHKWITSNNLYRMHPCLSTTKAKGVRNNPAWKISIETRFCLPRPVSTHPKTRDPCTGRSVQVAEYQSAAGSWITAGSTSIAQSSPVIYASCSSGPRRCIGMVTKCEPSGAIFHPPPITSRAWALNDPARDDRYRTVSHS